MVYGLWRAFLGVPGFLVTVVFGSSACRARRADIATTQKLDTSVGVSGPHDFAVRFDITRQLTSKRPSHPAPNVRDDREAPLLRVRNAQRQSYFSEKRK